MDILNLMYMTHVQQTSLPNPPFIHNLWFNYELVNKTKYKSLSSEENLDEFVKVCYEKYKERNPNHKLGSLDQNPKTWAKFALKAIVTAYKAKSDTVNFPNGCCSIDECPINLFYKVVLEEICLE